MKRIDDKIEKYLTENIDPEYHEELLLYYKKWCEKRLPKLLDDIEDNMKSLGAGFSRKSIEDTIRSIRKDLMKLRRDYDANR